MAAFAALGVGATYYLHGQVSVLYCVLSLLFAVNFLICYWEICLFRHRDYVESRVGYWLERNAETGGSPVVDFLTTSVVLRKALSPPIWVDVWASYARCDTSYADRRAYGFNIDVANGFLRRSRRWCCMRPSRFPCCPR